MAIGMWLTIPLLLVMAVIAWAYDVHNIPLYLTVPVGIGVMALVTALLDRYVFSRRNHARPRK